VPRTKNIALIDGSTYVMSVLMSRFSERLRDLGYHLVHTGGKEGFLVEEALRYADEQGFAGAVVWPYKGFPDVDEISRIAKNMPVLFMDAGYRGVDGDVVTYDHLAAGDMATEHLIQTGYRRIGVTGFLDMMETSHATLYGYMRAMFRHDLNPQARDYIFTKTSGMNQTDTKNLVRRLQDEDRPEALFVLQDECVPDTIEAIQAAGLRVPEDVAIVTVGDDISVDVNGIGLTAVAVDWERMAEEAVRLLMNRVDDPTRTTRRKNVPIRLVVRGLCGAHRDDWSSPDEERDPPYPRQRYRFSSSPSSAGAPSLVNTLNAEAYQ
jgi:DNA-binding LacI/PurR family transcriptional regulator